MSSFLAVLIVLFVRSCSLSAQVPLFTIITIIHHVPVVSCSTKIRRGCFFPTQSKYVSVVAYFALGLYQPLPHFTGLRVIFWKMADFQKRQHLSSTSERALEALCCVVVVSCMLVRAGYLYATLSYAPRSPKHYGHLGQGVSVMSYKDLYRPLGALQNDLPCSPSKRLPWFLVGSLTVIEALIKKQTVETESPERVLLLVSMQHYCARSHTHGMQCRVKGLKSVHEGRSVIYSSCRLEGMNRSVRSVCCQATPSDDAQYAHWWYVGFGNYPAWVLLRGSTC